METLLKVLGGLALFVIVAAALVALAFYLFIRVTLGKVKKLARQMGGPVAPVAVEVAVLDGTPRPEVERLAAELEARGFRRIAPYTILGVPDFEMIALAHEEEELYAAPSHHPMTGTYVDLFQSAPDGRTLTVTNGKEMSPPAAIPGRTVIRRVGASVETLMNEFRVARLTGEVNPTPPERFKPVFEEEYRRVMEFQYTEGILKGTDLAEMSRLTGMASDPETTRFLEGIGASARVAREEALRNAFLASGAVSAAEWEAMRDEVVFVHDGLDDDDLAALLEEFDIEETADLFLPGELDAAGGETPRDRFRNALARLGLADRVVRVGGVDRPEPCDVYRVSL